MKTLKVLATLSRLLFFLAVLGNTYTEQYEVALIDAVVLVALTVESRNYNKEEK